MKRNIEEDNLIQTKRIKMDKSNDISEKEFEEKDIEELKKKVLLLKEHSDNQPVQRTKEWFELRKTRITASDVGSCLKKVSTVCKQYMESYGLHKNFKHSEASFCNPYSNETDFILKKNGYSEFESNSAVRWGNKYEDAVVSFYERNFDEEIWEFGLLLHNSISWLACSPDGITPRGKMIEIKCPFRRKINGIPPIYYWIQCQIQLEVCDLEECDYIECNLENLTREQWEKASDSSIYIRNDNEKGTIKENKDLMSKGILININGTYYYPSSKYKTYQEMIRWADKKMSKYKDLKPEIEYYRVIEYSLINIKRSKEWFNNIKHMLEKTWEKVSLFHIDNYKAYLENKKGSKDSDKKSLDFRVEKNDVCLLSDEED